MVGINVENSNSIYSKLIEQLVGHHSFWECLQSTMFFSICRRARERFKRRAIEYVEESSIDEREIGVIPSEQTSWFERTCVALRSNDATMDVLEIDTRENPIGLEEVDEISNCLRRNSVCEKLVLRNLDISDTALSSIASALDTTMSITSLHLEDSGTIGQRGVARALSLSQIKSVRVLHLKGSSVDKKGAAALRDVLKNNRSLVELRMTHNRIDADSVACIADGLKQNKGLEILDLLGNTLDDRSVFKLSKALARHESLEFLCLDFNNFGLKGVQAIASMLHHNKKLKELHLFGNRIDSTGAKELAEALYVNSTLETLILSFNRIGDEGAAALARALTVNTTLTKMWFPSNSIGSEGLLALGAFLPKMKGLEQLHVGDFFDNFAAEALLDGLKSNTRLYVLYMECPIYEDPCIENKLDFYLRLNKSGRRLLQTSGDPVGLWAHALEKAGQNVSNQSSPDVLFHMLRQKPDLFDFVV